MLCGKGGGGVSWWCWWKYRTPPSLTLLQLLLLILGDGLLLSQRRCVDQVDRRGDKSVHRKNIICCCRYLYFCKLIIIQTFWIESLPYRSHKDFLNHRKIGKKLIRFTVIIGNQRCKPQFEFLAKTKNESPWNYARLLYSGEVINKRLVDFFACNTSKDQLMRTMLQDKQTWR